ncbi:hypothetical protein Pla108_11700 [Botrimarina colliarenosi]|uniref:Helix-turn-helix domain-containing protein n=1 Tax=Botrimarina colliarenosi TaxID=2528001 RepID=A0A5C6AJJ0_9BACT|nr:hypothetical protein [Botrimarina colliarenosi]TWU00223.1 hypothetical protein Pla108_11700 [Botrimarina colliarenosi]
MTTDQDASDGSGGSLIAEGELYTLAEFTRRMALGPARLRELRRDGLPVIRIGRSPYFSGRLVIAFMEERARDET